MTDDKEEIDFTPEIPNETVWQKIVLFFNWLWTVWFPVIFLKFALHDYNEKTLENPLWPEPYHSLPAILVIVFVFYGPIMNTHKTFKLGIYGFMKKQQILQLERKTKVKDSGENEPDELTAFFAIAAFFLLFYFGFVIADFIELQLNLPKDSGAHMAFSTLIGIALIISVGFCYGKMRKLWAKPRQSL
ncbi:MAG: hypothetical protein FD163_1183 [Hyphomonadaceae bacterium]|nr:MAG: hypothetical protein FD128_2136 [Hyphomonadaceae bacterium]KAF0185368.1 MAG: hypothetical protein FD163_1183 [Hyphomonadaceae bacterium]